MTSSGNDASSSYGALRSETQERRNDEDFATNVDDDETDDDKGDEIPAARICNRGRLVAHSSQSINQSSNKSIG